MIEFSSVRVDVPVWTQSGTRDSLCLLRDVNLTLDDQRVAVIGANGSGKSTLLRLINGLIRPSSGTVTVNGLSTSTDIKKVRRRVGFVFTDPLSQLIQPTPIEDIELSLRRRIRDRDDRREAALALLDRYQLGHLAHRSIYDLSGGERQLVSLATVLAVQPSVIVADEPTTLLDLRNRAQVCRALLDLDTQLIVATHDLDFVSSFDRALVVDGGAVVCDSTPDRAIDFYRRLIDVEI